MLHQRLVCGSLDGLDFKRTVAHQSKVDHNPEQGSLPAAPDLPGSFSEAVKFSLLMREPSLQYLSNGCGLPLKEPHFVVHHEWDVALFLQENATLHAFGRMFMAPMALAQGDFSPYLAGNEAIEDDGKATDQRLSYRARSCLCDDSVTGCHPLRHVCDKATHLDL